MDVSRIEAFNPSKINWRNLTAKEILKYEKQGIEVPDLYVQWAYQFLNNVQKYDNDEITYEKAQSITRHQSTEEKTNEKNIENSDKSKDSQEPPPEEAERTLSETTSKISVGEGAASQNGTEAIQMTAAQMKRTDFKDKGVNLRQQAVSFIQDSTASGQQAVSFAQIVRQIQNSSDNEIAELEGVMRELIAQAEAKQTELKQEVSKINSEKSDNSTFSKIDKLQKELEQLGMSGHNDISQTLGILRSYGGEIINGQEVMLNAADFGSETIDVGNELLSTTGQFWWFSIDGMVGQNAVYAGNEAMTQALTGENTVNTAQTSNNANIGRVPELRNSVTEKTGIDIQNAKQQGNASEQDPITGKEKESDKEIKTAQNDGTDTTDKLHISIDELVKRKVRRGEYAQGT